MSKCKVTNEGICSLLKQYITNSHSLTWLSLENTHVSDATLEVLGKSPIITTLHHLSLEGCDITDEGIIALFQKPTSNLFSLILNCIRRITITQYLQMH